MRTSTNTKEGNREAIAYTKPKLLLARVTSKQCQLHWTKIQSYNLILILLIMTFAGPDAQRDLLPAAGQRSAASHGIPKGVQNDVGQREK